MDRCFCHLAVVALVCSSFVCHAQGGSSPASNLDAIIANAKAHGDEKAERRATNLKYALRRLRPSELNGVQCGKAQERTRIDVAQAEDVGGKLLDKALEKYLPTLAAALASAPAAAVAAFLTPEKIGPDSVEILNDSEARPKEDVENAARQMLQDTLPDNFKKLPTRMTAKIVVCAM